MKMRALLLSIFVTVALSASAYAQKKVVVHFAAGTHSASKTDTIAGYKYVDYILGAKAEQNMIVELSSTGDKAQLVILDPNNENVENGTGVGDYTGTLEKSGNYTVRVLMSRAEARRKGAKTTFNVT